MKWITRERPKIDRIACPWLIARFIDTAPEFLYVPSGDVLRRAREEAGITAYVPPNRATNNRSDDVDLFERGNFTYDAENDQYQCPAGKLLSLKQWNRGDRIYQAAISDCNSCPLKARCTQAKRRYISRHAHEAAFERMEHADAGTSRDDGQPKVNR